MSGGPDRVGDRSRDPVVGPHMTARDILGLRSTVESIGRCASFSGGTYADAICRSASLNLIRLFTSSSPVDAPTAADRAASASEPQVGQVTP